MHHRDGNHSGHPGTLIRDWAGINMHFGRGLALGADTFRATKSHVAWAGTVNLGRIAVAGRGP